MGRMEGKVAFVTGAARGQGRSHAIRLAQEGADIVALDLAASLPTVPYAGATPDDLAETVQAVEALGRNIVATEADVRDYEALEQTLAEGVARFGRVDTVVANAGIFGVGRLDTLPEKAWREMLDVNLTGAWLTVKAAIPHLRAAGGGAVVITSSGAGVHASPNIGHYVSSKHGVIGLMRTLALELAGDSIRVNCVLPGTVDTPMVQNEAMYQLFRPDLTGPDRADFTQAARGLAVLDVPWVESVDVSNAVLFLVSDEARYITGVALPVDAGTNIK